jgi:DNA mismatch repair protein MutS
MEVLEQPSSSGDKIVFTYRFIDGAAGKSYGIHVAQLAGIPEAVVSRANQILQSLTGDDREKESSSQPSMTTHGEQRERSTPAAAHTPTPATSPVAATEVTSAPTELPLRTFLNTIEPNELTPRDALELIFELVKAAKNLQPAPMHGAESGRRAVRKKQWQTSDLPSLF